MLFENQKSVKKKLESLQCNILHRMCSDKIIVIVESNNNNNEGEKDEKNDKVA
jgi:hypothetical protein